MISRLYQDSSPFELPPGCEAGRTETTKRYIKNGKIYTMTWRNKVVIEDPYLVMVKAAAFAINVDEPYSARPPDRTYKDYLIRSSLVI